MPPTPTSIIRHRARHAGLLGGFALLVLCADVSAQDVAEKRIGLGDAQVDSALAEIESATTPLAINPQHPRSAEQGSPDAVSRFDWQALHEDSEAAIIRLLGHARERFYRDVAPVLSDFRSGQIDPDLARGLLGLLGVCVTSLFALRVLRGRGDLAVSIHYPSELRGTFNVRVAKRRSTGRVRRVADAANAKTARGQAGTASRFEHTMVSRETHFRDLLSRRYCVMVYGFIQPIDSDDVISTHLEEHEVRVRRRGTERLDFDFHPKECSIDVRVLWDHQPVTEAMVAVRAIPGSLRYARNGPARVTAGPGAQTLVVGSQDRVVEHLLEIRSMQPLTVEIELTHRDSLLFSGCPPAVEPYLNGDLTTAARALERDGQRDISNRILARLYHEQGQLELAARHYEAADLDLEAAELYEELPNFEKAAELFAAADEPARAADMWLAAGSPDRAGEAYERAHRLEAAVECYRESGDVPRWTAALERSGAPLEAAQVAIDHDDWGRAIRSLQQIATNDRNYVIGTNLLIDAYQHSGHLDLALLKTEELVNNQGIDDVSIDTCDRLAQLLEEQGEFEQSLGMLEIVRKRDATFPEAAARIEELKKKIAEDSTTGAVPAGGDAFGNGSRYELISELGRGGMGVVYRARDRRLGRVVALKRLPENLRNHPKAVQLFLREARSAAALNHPNIVTLYDAGQEDEVLYITMELLEGMPLTGILRSRGHLTARDTARLGIQIANGLHYAHEKRIIHRDIKTGNLFFTDSKKIKIMDFGLAKMVEEVRRASTVIGGTPYYMAPEQSLGGVVDHRADLYALGVTLFELLTGTVPFRDGDVAYHHRHTPAPDPRDRIDRVPDAFAELVLQLLEKEPDARCASAREITERLTPLAKNRPS
jgi:tRNA A-37 threonylcarbamoyl transferase component Bud32